MTMQLGQDCQMEAILGSAILDFWIHPKLQESENIEQKVNKANNTLTCAKNINVTGGEAIFLHFKKGFSLKTKMAVKHFTADRFLSSFGRVPDYRPLRVFKSDAFVMTSANG